MSAAGGSTSGNSLGFRDAFTASITGTAIYCEGAAMSITLSITGGVAPYAAVLTRSQSTLNKDTTISLIDASSYIINVNVSGTYDLKEITDNTGNAATVSGSVTLSFAPVPDVSISGLATAYVKQSTEWVLMTGTPAGGTFNGPGVVPNNTDWYFVPSLAPVGTNDIVYSYRTSPASCFGYDTAVVRVLEAAASIKFENDRTKYCSNDRPFTVSGVNIANSVGSFTISGGVGLTDYHNNTATVYPSQLDADEYTITYIYFDGTSLSVDGKFDVSIAPTADFTWESSFSNEWEAIVLTDASAAEYQWIDCENNNSPIIGATQGSLIISHDGNYAVIVSKNGCADTSTCYSVIITDLEINRFKQNITIDPNPNKGSFTVNLGKVHSIICITITDPNGRVIQKQNYHNTQAIETMLPTPPGIYFLNINSGNERAVFKIIKH